MGMWWRRGDGAAFQCLLWLGLMYGVIAFVAYTIVHMQHVRPLGPDAPPERFSEARAVEHIRYLTVNITGRQEGKPGLEEAARYIKGQLEAIKERAGPDYRVEIEETLISGSFSMMFLGHRVSLGYRNHKNIVMRISSNNSDDDEPSVLVNGHYDSPIGSPGAGDCGSCVASMLELSRLVVDSNWIPSRPLVFLFNGAEELFLVGSHGFVKTNKWSDTVGAFINIEASGSGGLDLVCQSGPGSWPSHVYAQSAKYPMANSLAQDVFRIIPGDTDYRIFAEDHSNIPGLDIIFVLGGYYYHTSYDTIERLLPGSIQARGENLLNLIKALANSSMVLNAKQRSEKVVSNGTNDDRGVYFDYLSWFMVYYSRKLSMVLCYVPVIVFLVMPLFVHSTNNAVHTCLLTYFDWMKGVLFHVLGVFLAIITPVLFAILRVLLSGHAMSWFAHPYLAFLMFVPSSLVGFLIPRTVCGFFSISQDAAFLKVSKEVLSDEACFWGAFGFYSFMTLASLLLGFDGGSVISLITISMVLAWLSFCLTSKHFGNQSLKSMAGYVIPLIPSLTYSVYMGGFFVQFLIEKMGMMGSLPQPYGYFVPDIIVAAAIGAVMGCCVGPSIPIVGQWLARSSIIQCLLQVTVLSLALSSQFFPYSAAAPKRIMLQHTFVTADVNRIAESSYDFSVLDANSLIFLFKYAPEAAKVLEIGSEFSFETADHSDRSTWLVSHPVHFMFSGSLKFPAQADDIFKRYRYMPQLFVREPVSVSETGIRRVNLELYLGSLEEIWVTALNITGPLSNWSFTDGWLPAPEAVSGGPPSYVCKLSGRSHDNWTFWLEANSSEALRVDVAVLDQHLVDDAKKLKSLFPSWVDVVAFSTFFSSYTF